MDELERIEVTEQEKKEQPAKSEQDNKKKKGKTACIIIGGVLLVAVIVAIVFCTRIYPGKQADKAYDEFISSYPDLMDSGKYDSISDSATAVLNENYDHLDDDQKSVLVDTRSFIQAVKMLDYTSGTPASSDVAEAQEKLDLVVGSFKKSNLPYDLCEALLMSIDKYNNDYHGVHGTLKVDYSKVDAEKKELTDEKDKEEYNCSGEMNVGFRKKDASGGLTLDNIETIYILDINVSDAPDEGICKNYKAVFLTDQTEGIEIKGTDKSGIEGTATYKNSEFKVEFGRGIALNISTAKPETKSSRSSSSSNKDYSPGSEWEKYDANKDGKISDDEYRDSVNDYMDDYYNEIGDGGNNLDAYDYNNDGNMSTDEFQDAVGDYMDSHGY